MFINASEKSIKTEYGTVYYYISDIWNENNDTIFFFHGLTADHSLFEKQFEHLNGKYNLMAWDAPCHGKSRQYGCFSFDDTSKIVRNIMDENSVEQIIAVGQSLGGYFIQALLKRYPESIKGFIGIGTTPYGKEYYSKSDIFWLKQIEWMGMCFPEKMLKEVSSKQATCTSYGYDNMIKMLSVYDKREYCHLMQIAYSEFLLDNTDIELNIPVLITYGENDRVGKVRHYCNTWAEKTGYPIAVIKNAGHNANSDNYEETNRIIDSFIQNIKES